MIQGLVSNCWRAQLEQDYPLESLLEQAVENDYRVVELRQSCLGTFEDAQQMPSAERLARLPERFPEVRFNLAVSIAFLGPHLFPEDALFAAACEASIALAGPGQPHLRLVDLHTNAEQFGHNTTREMAATVARLARALERRGGLLSVEHSLQPWRSFADVLEAAWELLGSDNDCLQLCFDPCNLLFPGDEIDPLAVTAALQPHTVSMIHFKQLRQGQVLERVMDGEVDWRALTRCIDARGFGCPGLFEIAPHEGIWNSLATSRTYLDDLGLSLG